MGEHDHHDHDDHHHDGSFDERARDWDDAAKIARARTVAAAIRRRAEIDDSTRVLEYGAGTGLASQALAAGPVGLLTLSDPSVGMRSVMADKVADGSLPAGTEIIDIDLGTDAASTVASRFDLIVTVMALHHIPEPRPVLAGFATALAPGGFVCIADLDREDGSFHADAEVDVHDGFSRPVLTEWLTDAGFTGVEIETVDEVERHERLYPLFLATARR